MKLCKRLLYSGHHDLHCFPGIIKEQTYTLTRIVLSTPHTWTPTFLFTCFLGCILSVFTFVVVLSKLGLLFTFYLYLETVSSFEFWVIVGSKWVLRLRTEHFHPTHRIMLCVKNCHWMIIAWDQSLLLREQHYRKHKFVNVPVMHLMSYKPLHLENSTIKCSPTLNIETYCTTSETRLRVDCALQN